MKRIGILSDTHSCWDDRYLLHFSDCDEVWHAGDIGSPLIVDRLAEHCLVRAVYGNIDGRELRLRYDEVLHFRVEECEVMMTIMSATEIATIATLIALLPTMSILRLSVLPVRRLSASTEV